MNKKSAPSEIHLNKKWKLAFRVFFIILLSVPIIFYKQFSQALIAYFTGSNILYTVKHQWHIVIINILFFISILIPLSYRRKVKWSEYGLVVAFFVSLFVEMYGVPLTLMFASNFFQAHAPLPQAVVQFSFMGVGLSMHIPMVYGGVLITAGTLIITIAWVTLYKNIKKSDALVTQGIYSFSRHPQYLGFNLIIIGWFFGWHTILTAILTPILIFIYIRVCFIEEREVSLVYQEAYSQYKKAVPFFF